MNQIDIDFNKHTIEQLRALNHDLVDHMRLRQQRESQQVMHKFNLGDQVCFENSYGEIVEGKIIRFNQKSVTVEKERGHTWRVSPQFLEKVVASSASKTVKDIQMQASEVISRVGQSQDIGKNSPCICGSGKKYKRCCLGNNNSAFSH